MEITMPHKEKASEMKHYAGKAVFSAAIGHALDGLDLMILSFALSGIIATFGVDNATAGSLTSITLAGAFLGGLVFGTLADKLGRIRVHLLGHLLRRVHPVLGLRPQLRADGAVPLPGGPGHRRRVRPGHGHRLRGFQPR